MKMLQDHRAGLLGHHAQELMPQPLPQVPHVDNAHKCLSLCIITAILSTTLALLALSHAKNVIEGHSCWYFAMGQGHFMWLSVDLLP